MFVINRDKWPEQLITWGNEDSQLWAIGEIALLYYPSVSVIGRREVPDEGIRRTKKIVKILVDNKYCIVSGLAKGVDATAHATTLDMGGYTIAVMGTSIEQCYPNENFILKHEIEEKGLVITPFPPKQRTHRGNFPKRNTLMAHLCEATIVIEAGEKSGTQHQIKSAIKLKKKVGFLA